MRKEKKSLDLSLGNERIYTYYDTNVGHDNENYAMLGFKENLYYTSDRTIKLDETFKRVDGKEMKGFGLEIELQSQGAKSDLALAKLIQNYAATELPNNLFKYQEDGSIREYGYTSVETITQVMTREFIRNNYPSWREFWTRLEDIKTGATLTTECGMHCNISNANFGNTQEAQYEAIRKFYYFINKNYQLSCVLVNRNANVTRYCSRMSHTLAKTMDLENFETDHSVCFNLGHIKEGRIELRLVGGQKNYACFRNTMECVFHLVEKMRTISWRDLDNLEKVFKGCNQYVLDRLSKCVNDGVLDSSTYENIKQNHIEVDFGNN